MSESLGSATNTRHKQHFQLNVISPLPEIGRLNFPCVATACTVLQLKEKISEASETRQLPPSQQRLIYRGRVLAQEQRTLGEIFGQETIDDSNEPLTLHLAFNPGPHQQSTAVSPPSQTRAQHAHTNPIPDTNQPFGLTEQVPRGGPHVASAAPAPAQALPILNPQMHVPQGTPFPQLQQTFALMNQQIAAQMAALGQPTMQNVGANQQQGQLPQPQYQHQPNQLHAHYHPTHGHPNPALVPQGIPSLQGSPSLTPQQQQLHQYVAQQNQPRVAADHQGAHLGTQRPNSAPPPGLGNTSTVIRETYGPNGERHQSIVSSGTIQLNNGGQAPNPGLRLREPYRNNGPRSETPTVQLPPNQAHQPRTFPSTPMSNMQLQVIQAHMLSMESAMNLGTIPPDSIQEQTRTLLQSVAPMIDQRQYQHLEYRRQTLSIRASAMQRGLDARLQATAEQVAAQRATRLSEDSSVYVLSSPAGPQALLVSPSGLFSTSWLMAAVPTEHPMGLPEPPILNTGQTPAANVQQAHNNAIQLAHPNPNGPQQVNVPHPPQEHQPQEQAPNPARDIVRILIPLGGHLWLLVRLFGFVYFFTHGASWHRTILLSLVAFLLFVAQTGLFQPLLQTMWGPIRRHAEALLPLAGNEQPQRNEEPAAANANATGTERRNRDPTPQEAAERLLREREAQDGNFVRLSLRRLERAVALFVASLVPGVGERHIAAREAAEAARQREVREREERARTEEEERQQAQSNDASGLTSGGAAAINSGESTGEHSSSQEPAAQPPLVEV